MSKKANLSLCFSLLLFLLGTPMWFLVQIAPITNDTDATVLYLLTYKDITLIKRPITADEKGKDNDVSGLQHII